MRYLYVIAASLALGLGGCASGPSYSSHGYAESRGGGYGYRCEGCGTVEDIDRVRFDDHRRTSGGGAVLGAIVGGAVGNQVGSGDGRRAATVAGAVIGGIAGNEIEKDRNRDEIYILTVRMDDGRRLSVEQYRLDGIREGSRVVVSAGLASLL